MIINTNGTPYKSVRGILGIAGSIGGAALAGSFLNAIKPVDVKMYKKVAIVITGVALVWAAGDLSQRVVRNQVDGIADGINEFGELINDAKSKISVNTTRGE